MSALNNKELTARKETSGEFFSLQGVPTYSRNAFSRITLTHHSFAITSSNALRFGRSLSSGKCTSGVST